MTMTWRHAKQYRETGFTVVWTMKETVALSYASRALSLVSEHGVHREGTSTLGGHSNYDVLDGYVCEDQFADLMGWYRTDLIDQVQKCVPRPLVVSPHPQSAVNIKVYQGRGNGQGWHYDTNPVSTVLYLTYGGSPTTIIDLAGRKSSVTPEPGRLLIMQGRSCEHEVPSSDGLRVVAVLNFYHPDDLERPAHIDRLIYGDSARGPSL